MEVSAKINQHFAAFLLVHSLENVIFHDRNESMNIDVLPTSTFHMTFSCLQHYAVVDQQKHAETVTKRQTNSKANEPNITVWRRAVRLRNTRMRQQQIIQKPTTRHSAL